MRAIPGLTVFIISGFIVVAGSGPAWVPATMTVEAAEDTRRGRWYFVLAVVLVLAGAVLEEYVRRRMRTNRSPT